MFSDSKLKGMNPGDLALISVQELFKIQDFASI